ncbi:5-demethoxyubiquinol-8 5-hydroxylase UbiM [Sphingomonadaceae bacterium jetA1]|jgi:ubiquinone biosynthesis UbiH/UbiF/VisC/COQ6 family hydroxylase|uniref:5-demethoxyubiquinol-8 5-hydroxylase UbiM n=1 Tax=Facivitalis istanbulensis TaxID=3075838 RepID=UPI00348554E4
MPCDIIIIGGGPAGLAFAGGLAGSGLRVTLVERLSLSSLADPADDGREIALTHRSVATLEALDAWRRIAPEAIAPLRAAHVLNGASPLALSFEPDAPAGQPLGWLVANHHIRRALFAAIDEQPGLTLIAGAQVAAARTDRDGASVTLEDGRVLRARLLVAADSRFSAIRAQLNIPAKVTRLGKSMLLARVEHDGDHQGIATEWFDHGQTIALLPLTGRRSSVVLTLPEDQIARLAALAAPALSAELTRRSDGRLGTMRVEGAAHVYPLATVWCRHFAAPRAALIGDAAVGMHPVTAHGFNLGLRGGATLAGLLVRAAARGQDIGAASLLRRYEAVHRFASAPLFLATGAIVGLFTDDRPPARLLRPALLHAAARVTPARAGISRLLMRH